MLELLKLYRKGRVVWAYTAVILALRLLALLLAETPPSFWTVLGTVVLIVVCGALMRLFYLFHEMNGEVQTRMNGLDTAQTITRIDGILKPVKAKGIYALSLETWRNRTVIQMGDIAGGTDAERRFGEAHAELIACARVLRYYHFDAMLLAALHAEDKDAAAAALTARREAVEGCTEKERQTLKVRQKEHYLFGELAAKLLLVGDEAAALECENYAAQTTFGQLRAEIYHFLERHYLRLDNQDKARRARLEIFKLAGDFYYMKMIGCSTVNGINRTAKNAFYMKKDTTRLALGYGGMMLLLFTPAVTMFDGGDFASGIAWVLMALGLSVYVLAILSATFAFKRGRPFLPIATLCMVPIFLLMGIVSTGDAYAHFDFERMGGDLTYDGVLEIEDRLGIDLPEQDEVYWFDSNVDGVKEKVVEYTITLEEGAAADAYAAYVQTDPHWVPAKQLIDDGLLDGVGFSNLPSYTNRNCLFYDAQADLFNDMGDNTNGYDYYLLSYDVDLRRLTILWLYNNTL